MRLERYVRQLSIPEIGESGQKKLLASSALVVGCGGLGSVLLYCLCGMGVGRIGFCDGDVVSLSNLNRQFLHAPRDIGRLKTESAFEKLSAFAPELTLEPMPFPLTEDNAHSIVSRYDVVLLAADTLDARLTANRACVDSGIPLVDGGVSGLNGTLLTVRPHKTPCLFCVYGGIPAPKAPVSSFAPIVSAVSALEAQAAANVLLGLPNPSDGTMLLFGGASCTLEPLSLKRRPECPVCGKA